MGWKTIGYVEHDERCKAILRQRIRDGIFDDAPIFDDVRTFDGRSYRGKVDCVSAGFPCQPFSCAGQLLRQDDERNLWPDTIRIVREVEPEWCLLENVTGLFRCDYIWTIFADLSESGFDAQWMPLSAYEVGADHERNRGWIVAHADRYGWDALQVLTTNLEATSAEVVSRREARNAAWGSGYDALQRMAYAGDIRGFDGLADWVDRLKAVGNGQVPAVVREAWNRLSGG